MEWASANLTGTALVDALTVIGFVMPRLGAILAGCGGCNPCAGVPAGERRVVVCNGTVLTTYPGTADGQTMKHDHVARKATWSNV